MVSDMLKAAIDPDDAAAEARLLSARHEGEPAERVLAAAIGEYFPGKISLVSSFGADSAVLLHLVAGVDRHLPVIFIDTGRLFGETLRHRDLLVDRLGLSDVRSVGPLPDEAESEDAEGTLWFTDAERCCALRKVRPLAAALEGFSAWISGRKRYQAGTRARLALFEAEAGRIKVNPLAGWTREQLDAYRLAHDLPAHPLVADGFRSIGCLPCTTRVGDGEDERAGRWRGQAKTECGIHFDLAGAHKTGGDA